MGRFSYGMEVTIWAVLWLSKDGHGNVEWEPASVCLLAHRVPLRLHAVCSWPPFPDTTVPVRGGRPLGMAGGQRFKAECAVTVPRLLSCLPWVGMSVPAQSCMWALATDTPPIVCPRRGQDRTEKMSRETVAGADGATLSRHQKANRHRAT